MESITIPCGYFYYGATCHDIIIEKDCTGIVLRNSYGEVMKRCVCASEIAQFIIDLQNGKFV